MDPYEKDELHRKWNRLMVDCERVIAAINQNVHINQDLDARREMVKLSYHHGWVSTNLKNVEPTRYDTYNGAKERLESIEKDVIEHIAECQKYI